MELLCDFSIIAGFRSAEKSFGIDSFELVRIAHPLPL
jgi:hypothetical protein